MSNNINQVLWLEEGPIGGSQPGDAAAGPNPQDLPPNNMSVNKQSGEDISDDPQYPDMPEGGEQDDFNIWKIKFVKESIKGDPNTLIQKLLSVRERDLTGYEFKFVEDNMDINMLRQNSNVLNVSNEIRKLVKKDFDRTNPSTTLVRHITDSLEKQPLLNEVYIKCLGLGSAKGDQHRKFVASLIGGVQVGSGMMNEDLIFEEQDYSIRISTRFNARWGDVNIGRWFLKEDALKAEVLKRKMFFAGVSLLNPLLRLTWRGRS
jgi:hypothetical protein